MSTQQKKEDLVKTSQAKADDEAEPDVRPRMEDGEMSVTAMFVTTMVEAAHAPHKIPNYIPGANEYRPEVYEAVLVRSLLNRYSRGRVKDMRKGADMRRSRALEITMDALEEKDLIGLPIDLEHRSKFVAGITVAANIDRENKRITIKFVLNNSGYGDAAADRIKKGLTRGVSLTTYEKWKTADPESTVKVAAAAVALCSVPGRAGCYITKTDSDPNAAVMKTYASALDAMTSMSDELKNDELQTELDAAFREQLAISTSDLAILRVRASNERKMSAPNPAPAPVPVHVSAPPPAAAVQQPPVPPVVDPAAAKAADDLKKKILLEQAMAEVAAKNAAAAAATVALPAQQPQPQPSPSPSPTSIVGQPANAPTVHQQQMQQLLAQQQEQQQRLLQQQQYQQRQQEMLNALQARYAQEQQQAAARYAQEAAAATAAGTMVQAGGSHAFTSPVVPLGGTGEPSSSSSARGWFPPIKNGGWGGGFPAQRVPQSTRVDGSEERKMQGNWQQPQPWGTPADNYNAQPNYVFDTADQIGDTARWMRDMQGVQFPDQGQYHTRQGQSGLFMGAGPPPLSAYPAHMQQQMQMQQQLQQQQQALQQLQQQLAQQQAQAPVPGAPAAVAAPAAPAAPASAGAAGGAPPSAPAAPGRLSDKAFIDQFVKREGEKGVDAMFKQVMMSNLMGPAKDALLRMAQHAIGHAALSGSDGKDSKDHPSAPPPAPAAPASALSKQDQAAVATGQMPVAPNKPVQGSREGGESDDDDSGSDDESNKKKKKKKDKKKKGKGKKDQKSSQEVLASKQREQLLGTTIAASRVLIPTDVREMPIVDFQTGRKVNVAMISPEHWLQNDMYMNKMLYSSSGASDLTSQVNRRTNASDVEGDATVDPSIPRVWHQGIQSSAMHFAIRDANDEWTFNRIVNKRRADQQSARQPRPVWN